MYMCNKDVNNQLRDQSCIVIYIPTTHIHDWSLYWLFTSLLHIYITGLFAGYLNPSYTYYVTGIFSGYLHPYYKYYMTGVFAGYLHPYYTYYMTKLFTGSLHPY
jgi:hypothetical protein